MEWLNNITYNQQGLVPCITQDHATKSVLMMAWQNEAAILATLETGYMHYYSRSRDKLWQKGEESGHVQELVELMLDCDGDTMLAYVNQQGLACHTGREDCFFRTVSKGELVENKPIVKDPDEIY